LKGLQVGFRVNSRLVHVVQQAFQSGQLTEGSRCISRLAYGQEEERQELKDVAEGGIDSIGFCFWHGEAGIWGALGSNGVELGDELDDLLVNGQDIAGFDVTAALVLFEGRQAIANRDKLLEDGKLGRRYRHL
jgi:hypothetical protein